MLGERELAAGKVSLKDMQGGEQEEIPLTEVISYVQERVQKPSE
jgi:histidyl-tRNA synthetase